MKKTKAMQLEIEFGVKLSDCGLNTFYQHN